MSRDIEAPIRVLKDAARKKDSLSDVDLDHQECARPTCRVIYHYPQNPCVDTENWVSYRELIRI